MTEIKAALTAEEWAHPIRIQAREYDSDRNAAAEIVRDGDAIHITEHEHRRYGVIDTPEQKHALVALCLYGQPFGFTAEEVETLDSYVDSHLGVTGEAAVFARIAEKIRALLP